MLISDHWIRIHNTGFYTDRQQLFELSAGDGALHGLQPEGRRQERGEGLCERGGPAQGVPPLHVHQDRPRALPQDCPLPPGPHPHLQDTGVQPGQVTDWEGTVGLPSSPGAPPSPSRYRSTAWAGNR